MTDRYTPLAGLDRAALIVRLEDALLGQTLAASDEFSLGHITGKLETDELRELVSYVEAPALVEQRIRARLLVELVVPDYSRPETTTVEGQTSTPSSETRG